MVIKESSDELNAGSAVEQPTATELRRAQSSGDYLALAIATCGVGYLPIAPGTFGSMIGVGLYLLVVELIHRSTSASGELPVLLAVELILVTGIALIGIWAATRVEKLSGRKDPGKVVVDEVAGQLMALLPVLPTADPGWFNIFSAFLLFRLFDIIKPYPARRLESLESGLGIMADDVVAGAYAAVGVSVIVVMRSFI
jgi:phosphatidylglycerophosphatase A